MIRYIDAESLENAYKYVYCRTCTRTPQPVICSSCWVDDALDVIDDSPTEDVAPVVHAHWVDHKNNYVPIDASGDVSRSAFCSNCREWLTASDEYACRGNYCPNCGAKMDEEVE